NFRFAVSQSIRDKQYYIHTTLTFSDKISGKRIYVSKCSTSYLFFKCCIFMVYSGLTSYVQVTLVNKILLFSKMMPWKFLAQIDKCYPSFVHGLNECFLYNIVKSGSKMEGMTCGGYG
ncbi:hypothetical protein L9F63_000192, partial [Diploptera punctata]